jgi:hypothetical protein
MLHRSNARHASTPIHATYVSFVVQVYRALIEIFASDFLLIPLHPTHPVEAHIRSYGLKSIQHFLSSEPLAAATHYSVDSASHFRATREIEQTLLH